MELKAFDDLIQMGQLTKTLKLGAHEFKLKTLSSGEYVAMTKKIPEGQTTGQAEKFEALQRITLSHAIEAIDGQTLSVEEKDRLLSVLQLAVSNILYDAYMDLVTEQNKQLEDVKKNSSLETAISS
jgi:hypothetical protein